MNRRLIAVVIVLVAVALILGFFLTSKKVETPVSIKPESNIQKYMSQARETLEEGNLLKAKQIYSKIIEQYPDSQHIKNVQKELEQLNMKILFSPIKAKDDIIYVVKEEDTLGRIAKKYNTTVELLTRSNGLSSDLIHPGKHLKVNTAKFSIIVDISQDTLTLRAGDEILKTYTVSTGAEGTTPTGKFTIVNKLVDPVWYKAGAIVPPGSPENILGSRWMGISEPGYGIHGTTQPESIGKRITAGCIRMHNSDVEELYTIILVGTEVMIVD